MKFLKQFGVILLITFLGEGFKYFIPLPIPASIYGLILMLIALMTGIIKLEQVKESSGFLIEIMPLMFIPAAVGILNSWIALKDIWFPVIIITMVTTVIVMVITGRVTQLVIRLDKRRKA
ncbi:CidA/LrgA family protein [Clostridium aminobutyricum]|uniref:CidA/LrgA family protein n=1 Tax=Clostridium aminobutyricum TaxID=33953 RepID=A0A939D9I4_CLOAM|nr:CidA/LrgA family protein [Clostridium aminobutyricum]MBN7773610.1 CidA/LrgA family protein [Clostridium aminobutyricum]